MMRRLDHWIGTRLFHPPIIWLCHRLGMTQHAVARYAWMVAGFAFVMRIGIDKEGGGAAGYMILAGLISASTTLTAALLADYPTRPSFVFRLFLLLTAALDLVELILIFHRSGMLHFRWSLGWDLFALTGEYAKTLSSIPPRPARRRRRQGTVSRRATAPSR